MLANHSILARLRPSSAKHCYSWRTAPLFSLPFPAWWGRVWKGKPCVPFLGCGGLETITKRHFLRFFQAHRAAFLPAVSGIVGKGLERETLCPFPRLRRFGTHSETGSKFLLLFSIKSKEGILCFAETVLNWRNTHVAQAKLLRDCAIFSLARMRPFKLPSSSTLSAFSANPPTAPSPAPHPPA